MMAMNRISTASRRDALAALGGTGLAGIAGLCWARPEGLADTPKAPAGDDSRLLDLVAQLQALTTQHDRLSAAWGDVVHLPEQVDAELVEISDQEDALRDQIAATPSTTAAGAAAKAKIAANLVLAFPDDLDSTDRLMLSLCRDIVEGATA